MRPERTAAAGRPGVPQRDPAGDRHAARRPSLLLRLLPADEPEHRKGDPPAELFDLGTDPAEIDELSAESPREVAYYRALVDAWLEANRRSIDTSLSEDDLDALRELGYLEDGR